MFKTSFQINGHVIGGEKTYIIAEMSCNHNQNYDQALAIVRAAKESGADAIKIQTYTPDTMTIRSDQPYFQIKEGTIWEGKTLHDLYGEAYTPWEWQPKLQSLASELGLDFFSSPFDFTAVDFLESLKVPVYKVASFEIVDFPLLKKIGQTKKPVILSTGMSTLDEIQEAVQTLYDSGCRELAILKCTSAYPAALEEMNLKAIPFLIEKFRVPIGLSDHTMDLATPVCAVALGAKILEKHLILSRNSPSPDHEFSLEPAEFKEMVDRVRAAEKLLGKPHCGMTAKEESSRAFRRSLFVVQDVEKGEPVTAQNVRAIRPGMGLHTRYLDQVLGKTFSTKVKRGSPLSWEMMEKGGSHHE